MVGEIRQYYYVSYLIIVSLIWAASFSLIKTHLVSVQPDLVNAIRLLLAFGVFLPFLRKTKPRRALELALIGAVQFGAMYAFYTRSFGTLKAFEASLATITTPLFITLLEDLLDSRFRWQFLACALLATLGTAVSLGAWKHDLPVLQAAPWKGFLLIQASNLCFAIGQVWYRRANTFRVSADNQDPKAFSWCMCGAAITALIPAIPALHAHGWPALSSVQWGVLAYLGIIASGLCFFLWNVGARKVNTGLLAVMNDVKIPSAMLVALLFFGERAAWPQLAAGSSLILLALWLAARCNTDKNPRSHCDVGFCKRR